MENYLNNGIFSRIDTSAVSIKAFLICTAISLLCGIIISAVFSYRTRPSKSFTVTLLLLPIIVQAVIMVVNGNLGTGIAVAGAFSLVRFRSAPGRACDIAAIFLAMTAGLVSAAGYVATAVLFSIIVCAVYLAALFIPSSSEREYDLRMTVPENMYICGVFDDIFEKYTISHRTVSIKTSNMGTLYKLHYKIELSSQDKCKELIDELRCRNGNLEISISTSERAYDGSEL